MFAKCYRYNMAAIALSSLLGTSAAQAVPTLEFTQLWTQQSDEGSEIVAIDQASGRVFNTSGDGVEVRDINTGALYGTFTVPDTGGVNSVAVSNGILAVAAQANVTQDPGVIAFFNASDVDPDNSAPINTVTAGALPDMVTFTPDGNKVLVANEGEPNDAYTIDPEGSISIIDISGGVASATVTNLDFTAFNGSAALIEADGGRIFGPGASVAMDLEPEYITVSPDGQTAFVTLQENNAVARIDLATETIVEIQGLGFKDHSDAGNALDPSDRDDGINITNWPVLGMYQPDSIDSYEVGGQLYYVTANEGDARDYGGFSEETRVEDLLLDAAAYPDAGTLQMEENLGRLKTTTATGDNDGDGDFDQIYSYGARSFSIWDENGDLIFDSGEMIERLTAQIDPSIFNQNEGNGVADNRSDDKGPEPEALSLVEIGEWVYALVGLERTGGLMVFDVTDPTSPVFQQWLYNAADIGPEGIAFSLLSENSRGGTGYVAVANEVSNTTTFYQVSAVPAPASVVLMAIGLLALRRRLTA
ncbi:MAG: choice-of-anchor I family protein [Xanthomonadales bacterium]|jgi:DNA-binding beta-propeller fold protein YncE|nr:choice-of-anchor I family protein [Xanthomonadales bacterium]